MFPRFRTCEGFTTNGNASTAMKIVERLKDFNRIQLLLFSSLVEHSGDAKYEERQTWRHKVFGYGHNI